jgi:uncharacterized membrane protein
MSDVNPSPVATRGTQRMALRLCLWAGIVGPILFVLVFTVDGALTPGYSAMRDVVSFLELGPAGWIQRLNFILTGLIPIIAALGNLYSSFVVSNASNTPFTATTSRLAFGGLINRILILVIFAWYVILASRMLMRERGGVKAPGE